MHERMSKAAHAFLRQARRTAQKEGREPLGADLLRIAAKGAHGTEPVARVLGEAGCDAAGIGAFLDAWLKERAGAEPSGDELRAIAARAAEEAEAGVGRFDIQPVDLVLAALDDPEGTAWMACRAHFSGLDAARERIREAADRATRGGREGAP